MSSHIGQRMLRVEGNVTRRGIYCTVQWTPLKHVGGKLVTEFRIQTFHLGKYRAGRMS
jgi:hypothetical protein